MQRHTTPAALRCGVLLILVTVLSACGGTPVVSDVPSEEFAQQGLFAVEGSGFDSAYVLPEAGFDGYRAIIITPLDLANTEMSDSANRSGLRQNSTITPTRQTALQQAWDRSAQAAFRDYAQGGSDDETLRIEAAITRIATLNTRAFVGPAGAPQIPNDTATEVAIEIRLYDQSSSALLAVVRDRRNISTAQWQRAQGADAGTVSLFNTWSRLLQARISGR